MHRSTTISMSLLCTGSSNYITDIYWLIASSISTKIKFVCIAASTTAKCVTVLFSESATTPTTFTTESQSTESTPTTPMESTVSTVTTMATTASTGTFLYFRIAFSHYATVRILWNVILVRNAALPVGCFRACMGAKIVDNKLTNSRCNLSSEYLPSRCLYLILTVLYHFSCVDVSSYFPVYCIYFRFLTSPQRNLIIYYWRL